MGNDARRQNLRWTRPRAGKEGRDLLQALGMVGVDPLNLQMGQQGLVDQLDLHGDQGDVLESIVTAASKVVGGLNLADQHDVLNTHSKLAVLVVTRLVGQGHTRDKGNVVVSNAGTASMGSLVHVQEGADTVTGSVTEVETVGPESTTSKDIQKVSRSSIGEDSRVNGNVTLENASEAALFISSGGLEVQCTGHISGSINVLSTRVAQVDQVGVNTSSSGLFGLVVNDGTVRSSR